MVKPIVREAVYTARVCERPFVCTIQTETRPVSVVPGPAETAVEVWEKLVEKAMALKKTVAGHAQEFKGFREQRTAFVTHRGAAVITDGATAAAKQREAEKARAEADQNYKKAVAYCKKNGGGYRCEL